jgi:formylglycine-generating enzyme required for sulfatase activity
VRGSVYPWGNDWVDGICNTEEAGLGVTSPVGLFPGSRQPEFGIEDLAGNVWEWCAGADIEDPYDTGVLRGGCWSSFHGARAANRGRVTRSGRSLNFGFRVVCSSRSSGTEH